MIHSFVNFALIIRRWHICICVQPIGNTKFDGNLINRIICCSNKVWLCIRTPDHRHISTSHTERQNLTMRMQMRRFTWLTNAFSKKIENHETAIALHYVHYNFARVYQTLRCAPAMEAGVSNHVWNLEEIVGLL